MSLITNLSGRIRNTNLPLSHGLMPVFEAVVNSIQAIEDSENSKNGRIFLEIVRKESVLDNLDEDLESPISDFIITDNGCGFNEENYKSFQTLDSDYKIKKGCRGLGRLMWLKVFDSAAVTSTYLEDKQEYKKRKFLFTSQKAISDDSVSHDSENKLQTIVSLNGFDANYRDHVPRKLNIIADNLLEHALWYFVREGSSPEIIIKDENREINLSNLFDSYMKDSAVSESITIKGHVFELTHIKFRNIKSSYKTDHKLAWCASNRLVKEEKIKSDAISGLYDSLKDEMGEFYYTCYITSPYLDERVVSERTGFNIEEDSEDMYDNLSFKTLRQAVIAKSSEFLKPYLQENIQAGKERIDRFVSEKAPQYRSIINHINEKALAIDPKMTDEKLDLHLHSQKYKIENQLLAEGHKIMQPKVAESMEDYKVRLDGYLQKVDDIKKSDLAKYVSHRRVIIDLFKNSLNAINEGKYEKEEVIHKLIVPMTVDSDEIDNLDSNLWLIDERLAFHNYLASDKTLKSMPITEETATKEPDILSLRVFDEPILVSDRKPPLASITVVEIKRPMRNDISDKEDKDPISQCLNYLDKVRNGKVKTKSGRPIPNSKDIPGYCYILCDLTETMINRCKERDLMPTSDNMGYFGYHKTYGAYIEVISFDQLVIGATERNNAFFSQLGIPSI